MKNGRQHVAAYIRVSDPSQVEGHSLDAQLAEIQAFCDRRGYDLVQVYREDGVTARSERIDKRPQLVSLLQEAPKHTFEIVAVHTVDRWSRNLAVQTQALKRLGEAGAGFVSVTQPDVDFTTSTGKLLLNMMGMLSEYVSDQLGEHVQKSQRHRARLGLPVGPVPFGYETPEPGGVPQAVEREAEALREVFRRRDAGDSYQRIADWLNAQGFRTRDGNRFTAHAMKDIFNNPFYVGVIRYRGEEYRAKHEPIIPRDLFDRVQARRHRRTFQRQVDGERGAAQGRIFCVRCSNSLQSDRHRDGKAMYRERHAHRCETNDRSLMAHIVDDQIGLVFGSLEIPNDWRDRMAELAARQNGGVDIGRLQTKRKRVVRAFLDENISEEEYRRRLAEIDGQIQVAHPASQPSVEEAAALFNDLPALWGEATNTERQRLLGPLIDKVYIDVELRLVAAITPAPAFRLLLDGALRRTERAACLVLSPEQAAKWWRWWRRGRIELPVQRRAALRSYRRVRRLVLVRRAVAGPASPDAADESWAIVIGVGPPHPD